MLSSTIEPVAFVFLVFYPGLIVAGIIAAFYVIRTRTPQSTGNGRVAEASHKVTDSALKTLEEVSQERDVWMNMAINNSAILGENGIPPITYGLQVTLNELAKTIADKFSTDELDSLAMDVDIKPDELDGGTLSARARSLVMLAHRSRKLPRLREVIRKERPR